MTPAGFFLGTHEPYWLGREELHGVPLFVSARRLRRITRPPQAVTPWALDSGGFSEISDFGQWMTPPEQYVDEIARWSEQAGGLAWAAPHLRERAAVPVIPVLQGWEVPDYLACMRLYKQAGIDLHGEPVVGLGTVCRRQSTREGAAIVRELARGGLRLHGFGFKRTGLGLVGELLHSADSLAWSYNGRRNPRIEGHKHKSCGNCMEWALRWRGETLEILSRK